MNTFDLIQARMLLQYEDPITYDDKVWVTDGLKNEAMGWFQMRKTNANMLERHSTLNDNMFAMYPKSQWPVLIQAPTGRGKNWFARL